MVGTYCRGGFRSAFLSKGHGTAKRAPKPRGTVGEPPNPTYNMYCVELNPAVAG